MYDSLAALPTRRIRAARGIASAVLAAGAAAVLFAFLQPTHGRAVPVVDSAFCLLAPKEAHADLGERPDVQMAASVPMETPEMSALATYQVAASQGNVVRVAVTSPRDGGIAVHGLLDVQPISAGQRITVGFRAIYSGRFPVHFHGADGSHFEIAAIEVLPSGLTR